MKKLLILAMTFLLASAMFSACSFKPGNAESRTDSETVKKEKPNKKNTAFGKNADGTYAKDSRENAVSEQDTTNGRISFEQGKTSTTVNGEIYDGEENSYLIGARSGQMIHIEITDGGENNDVVFYLVAPDGSRPMGDEDGGGYDSAWSGKLRKTGDYKIVVSAIETKNTMYKMFIEIR